MVIVVIWIHDRREVGQGWWVTCLLYRWPVWIRTSTPWRGTKRFHGSHRCAYRERSILFKVLRYDVVCGERSNVIGYSRKSQRVEKENFHCLFVFSSVTQSYNNFHFWFIRSTWLEDVSPLLYTLNNFSI